MKLDLRPLAINTILCTNKLCKDKCKRYYENWQPCAVQSYVNPSIIIDKNGIEQNCEMRML